MASVRRFDCAITTGVLEALARRMIRYAYWVGRWVRFGGGQACSQVRLIPRGTATACNLCGVTGVGTKGTAARFEGSALLPAWFWLSTRYSAKSPVGDCSGPARESFTLGAGGWLSSSARWIRACAACLTVPATARDPPILPSFATNSPSAAFLRSHQ